MKITYLDHSGFAVETANYVLIFDFYRDPAKAMANILRTDKRVAVFSSHAHHDHFTKEIAMWNDKVAAYILHDDIRAVGGLPSVEGAKVHYVKNLCRYDVQGLIIDTYGSTDEGCSFAVTVDGWRIFHAGDFNWWHWSGDTAENIAEAERLFRAELAHIVGQSLDVAFFPVDSRLAEHSDRGIKAFSAAVQVGMFVTMHHNGEAWTVPQDFGVEVWVPNENGEERKDK